MRKKINLIITLMFIMVVTFGCGKIEELQNNITSSLIDTINEEGIVDEECPEGYVYDYQVSMEPIPEEIAALGGDVYGTIHAYPTRIKIALAKQKIENNPELQEQNEKNIQGVQRYLADTYGGAFEIEPLSTGLGSYMCTEISTGKEFVIDIYALYAMGVSDDVVDIDMYYYGDNAQKYNEDIEAILLNNLKEDYVFRTRVESVETTDILYLKLAMFREEKLDYIREQDIIINLYEDIREMIKANNDDMELALIITYFTPEYKDVITKQYLSDNINDMAYIHHNVADKLIEKREILGQFEYHETVISEENNQLKKISEDKETYFKNEYILPYWRGRE